MMINLKSMVISSPFKKKMRKMSMSSRILTIPLSATLLLLVLHISCHLIQVTSSSSPPLVTPHNQLHVAHSSLSSLPSSKSHSRILISRVKRETTDLRKKLVISLNPDAFQPMIPIVKENKSEHLVLATLDLSPKTSSIDKSLPTKPSMTLFTSRDASVTLQPKKHSHVTSTTLPPQRDTNQDPWSPTLTTVRTSTHRRSSSHSQGDHTDQESIQEIRLSNPPPNLFVYRPSKKKPIIPSPEEIHEIVQRLGVGRNAVALYQPKSHPVDQEKPSVISIPQQHQQQHRNQPLPRPSFQGMSTAASSSPVKLTTDDIPKPSVVPIDAIGMDVQVALQKIIEDLMDKRQFFSIPHNSIYDATKLISGKFSEKLAPAVSSFEKTPSRNHYVRDTFKQYGRENAWNSKYGFPDKHRSQDQGSHVALFADRRPNFEQENGFVFPHSSRQSRPSFLKDYLPPPHPMSSFYLSGNERTAGNELKPYYMSAKSGLGPGLRSFANYVKVITDSLVDHPSLDEEFNLSSHFSIEKTVSVCALTRQSLNYKTDFLDF